MTPRLLWKFTGIATATSIFRLDDKAAQFAVCPLLTNEARIRFADRPSWEFTECFSDLSATHV
jgi:hypothetical protein